MQAIHLVGDEVPNVEISFQIMLFEIDVYLLGIAEED